MMGVVLMEDCSIAFRDPCTEGLGLGTQATQTRQRRWIAEETCGKADAGRVAARDCF